jgi:hypothetical protein
VIILYTKKFSLSFTFFSPSLLHQLTILSQGNPTPPRNSAFHLQDAQMQLLSTEITSYPHDSALTKRFVVKITVERCDVFLVGVPQIFDGVKSVALWSAKKWESYTVKKFSLSFTRCPNAAFIDRNNK